MLDAARNRSGSPLRSPAQKTGQARRCRSGPLTATRPLPFAGFDPGCCRGQKTPPTKSRPRLGSRIGRNTPVGAALAATRRLPSAGFDPGCCRDQKTPPTEPRPRLGSWSRRITLWERPWPRHGGCRPPASIQAAVGVRRPLPQNPGPASVRGAGASPLWERPWPRHGGCRSPARSRQLSGSEDPSHRVHRRARVDAAY
jgi:hypothetical protein